MSPLLNRRTTLKDALSLLLDADVQAGIVVDRSGAVLGVVTADTIADLMRETARETPFTPPLEEVARAAEPAEGLDGAQAIPAEPEAEEIRA